MIKNTFAIPGVDEEGNIIIKEITEIWLEPGDEDYVEVKDLQKD